LKEDAVVLPDNINESIKINDNNADLDLKYVLHYLSLKFFFYQKALPYYYKKKLIIHYPLLDISN
jgi:hypothetical protein